MKTLSPRGHALAAVGVTVVLVLLPLTLLVTPAWQARSSFNERRTALEQQAGRYQALAARTADLKKQVERLLARTADRSGFLPETSTALAAAALQRRLQSALETHGGNVQSVQNLPAPTSDPFPKVIVRLQANISLEALGPFLASLASDPQLLEVDEVFIQTRFGGGVVPGGVGTHLLDLRLDVAGYLFEIQSDE